MALAAAFSKSRVSKELVTARVLRTAGAAIVGSFLCVVDVALTSLRLTLLLPPSFRVLLVARGLLQLVRAPRRALLELCRVAAGGRKSALKMMADHNNNVTFFI